MSKRAKIDRYVVENFMLIMDTDISLTAKGIWGELLRYMYLSEVRGQVTGTVDQLTRLVRAYPNEFQEFLDELSRVQFANLITHNDGQVTIARRETRKS